MQADEFIKKVRVRAGFDNNDQARKATTVVFETLRARISHAGGDNLAAQLPKELKDIWESGPLEHLIRSIKGVEHLDLGGFLARVAKEADLKDIQEAESVTRAVFMTLEEQITPGMIHAVEHQLPHDIKQFWMDCAPKEAVELHEPLQEEPVIGPLEMEAPVETDAEMLATAGIKGGGLPTELDTEMIEAQTEAQVRDMACECEEYSVSEQWVEDTGNIAEEPSHFPRKEEEVEPPAVDRMDIITPAKEHEMVEGPGSPTHYRSDAELTEEIKQMLSDSDELDDKDIEVFVQAGNVTLRGSVKSHDEMHMAGHIAAKALGIGDIRNELEIVKE